MPFRRDAFRTAKRARPTWARPQSVDKAHKRKNCPDEKEIGGNFCFLGLRTFSTLCQSVDFVNILSGRAQLGRARNIKGVFAYLT